MPEAVHPLWRDLATQRCSAVTHGAASKGVLQPEQWPGSSTWFHNAASKPRMVIVEQPRQPGWTLDSEPQPFETTPTTFALHRRSRDGTPPQLLQQFEPDFAAKRYTAALNGHEDSLAARRLSNLEQQQQAVRAELDNRTEPLSIEEQMNG